MLIYLGDDEGDRSMGEQRDYIIKERRRGRIIVGQDHTNMRCTLVLVRRVLVWS